MVFNTFDELMTYVNTYIISNGMELIRGDEHNAVENGLLEFIRQSPLNWQKAKIESVGGIVAASRPVIVFMTSTPTSLSWPDNIYNEYVFINTTSNAILLASGFVYYDINLSPVNSIAAKSEVNIIKASNNLWVQRKGVGSYTSGVIPFFLAKKVDGQSGSPIAGLTTYQNDDLKNAIGLVEIIVNNGNENIIDGNFTFNPATGTLDRSPNKWFTGDSLVFWYSKYLPTPVIPTSPSINRQFTNVTSYDIPWTAELIALRGTTGKFDVYMDVGGGVISIIDGIPITTDSITNPTNYHFDFGIASTGVIVF